MTHSFNLDKPFAGGKCEQRLERFEEQCSFASVSREAMRAEFMQQPEGIQLCRMLFDDRPYLFADSAVFVTGSCVRRQQAIIAAVENVIALPAYQSHVLSYAPGAAQFIPKARSVFFGYDFHLTLDGPRLIEINTNAGGALLNAILARMKNSMDRFPLSVSSGLERAFVEMFIEEWRLERGGKALSCIAIVDENPESQYMFPEFILFKQLFERNGIKAVICDPSELDYRDHALWHGNQCIDLVYNRLTDFGLDAPEHAVLLEAYLSGAAVLTPHPRAHALYANKKNLALLTNEAALIDMGVDSKTRAILIEGIAQTVSVYPDDAEALWSKRKQLFFKPSRGYGSKAVYRGDKLTRGVFAEILQGDYVAQALVLPIERSFEVGNKRVDLKFDMRHYVYKGRTQLISARLYQGQTTNFRTPGGGFARVMVVSG